MNRRKLVWTRTAGQTALTPATDAEVIDLLGSFRGVMGLLANLPGTTVSRIRFEYFSAGMTAGTFPLYLGIRKVGIKDVTEAGTDPAYALQLAPPIDAYVDWMMWKAIYPNHGADATSGTPNAATYEIDVKSMRKLEDPGDTLGLFLYKGTSTGGVTAFWNASVLLALP